MEYITLSNLEENIRKKKKFEVLITNIQEISMFSDVIDKFTFSNQLAWDRDYRGKEGKIRLLKSAGKAVFEFNGNGGMHWCSNYGSGNSLSLYKLLTCESEEIE